MTVKEDFAFDHLSSTPVQEVAIHFAELAEILEAGLPDGVEKIIALRALSDSRDAAVAAAFHLPVVDLA